VGGQPGRQEQNDQGHEEAAAPGYKTQEADGFTNEYRVDDAVFGDMFGGGQPQSQAGEGAEHANCALNDSEFPQANFANHPGDEDGSEQPEQTRQDGSDQRPKRAADQSPCQR